MSAVQNKAAPIRENLVAVIQRFLIAGMDVDLVGRVGSGRTTILNALEEELREVGWNVLRVSPVEVERDRPLSAINLAVRRLRLFGPDSASMEADTYLERAVSSRPMVVLVDNWCYLDDASWAVIDKLRQDHSLPVLTVHGYGPVVRQVPGTLPNSAGNAPVTVEVPPRTIDELKTLLSGTISGEFETETLSRIYSKSAGLPGLALAIAQVARLEGSIIPIEEQWTAIRDLWSDALQGVVRRQLDVLRPEQIDALAALSSVGLVSFEEALKLVEGELLEELEEQDYIRIEETHTHRWVSINPPILAEYFRHVRHAFRAHRLEHSDYPLELLSEHLSDEAGHLLLFRGADPLYLRLMREQARSKIVESQNRWVSSPNAGTALAYAKALVSGDGPVHAIEQVLAGSQTIPGEHFDLVRLRAFHAEWLAYVKHDEEAAFELLSDEEDHGPYSALLVISRIRLRLYLGGSISDLEPVPEITPESPLFILNSATQLKALIFAVQGRFEEAEAQLAKVSTWADADGLLTLQALHALVLLGQGRFVEAAQAAVDAFERARGELDVDALRSAGYVIGLLMLSRGRRTHMIDVLEELLVGPGYSPYYPRYLFLGSISTVAFGGNHDEASLEQISGKAHGLELPDGPFPGMSTVWPLAATAEAQGDAAGAAALLWQSAETLQHRGLAFGAIFDGLYALELEWSDARARTLAEWIESVNSPLLEARWEYLRAAQSGDISILLGAVTPLVDTGQVSHAAAAYSAAAHAAKEAEDDTQTEYIEKMRKEFLANLEHGTYTSAVGAQGLLSARERNIAELVGLGLTNREIAERLQVSLRTVENHIHRSIRKTGARSRKELGMRVYLFDQ